MTYGGGFVSALCSVEGSFHFRLSACPFDRDVQKLFVSSLSIAVIRDAEEHSVTFRI